MTPTQRSALNHYARSIARYNEDGYTVKCSRHRIATIDALERDGYIETRRRLIEYRHARVHVECEVRIALTPAGIDALTR